MSDNETNISSEGSILQNFRDYYMKNGSTPESVVSFIASQEERLAAMDENSEPVTDEQKDEICEFYEYFSSQFGDDAGVMDMVEQRWEAKPPELLLLGFTFAIAKEENELAHKFAKIRVGSREEHNILELAFFIAAKACRVSIIGDEDSSYEFDWPMDIASDSVTDIDVLKGMLTDFITSRSGMIVRRFGEGSEKDTVYGFMSDNGAADSMETEALTFAMGSHADETMKDYLGNVEIKKAELKFR